MQSIHKQIIAEINKEFMYQAESCHGGQQWTNSLKKNN